MTRDELRAAAVRLRAEKKSYPAIARELGVSSFSTVRQWCQDDKGGTVRQRSGRNRPSGPSGKHRAKRPKRPSGRKAAKWERARLVTWDGEAITLSGPPVERQLYTLLANSDGAQAYNVDGLSTEECFGLLLSSDPNAYHVIFGGQFDFDSMLRDLPDSKLRELARGDRPVSWKQYRILYRPKTRFWLQEVERVPGPDPVAPRVLRSITVYDIVGQLEGSFLNSVRKCLNLFPDDLDFQIIEAGKARRSDFGPNDREFMVEYNAAELRQLVRLADWLREVYKAAKWHPHDLAGAGAIAAGLLTQHTVKAHMPRLKVPQAGRRAAYEVETIPAEVRAASLSALAKGRMELIQSGCHRGPVYHYDITSCYPAAYRELPSLKDGAWTHHKGASYSAKHQDWQGDEPAELEDFGLYRVISHLPNVAQVPQFAHLADDFLICPFFHRLPGSAAALLFPCQEMEASGWYWGIEVKAAARHFRQHFHIAEWWTFEPATAEMPFACVQEVADYRVRLKTVGNPAHIPLKLGLNAVEGKLWEQKSGEARDGYTKLPPYFQPEWAGYISAWARARLLDAVIQNPTAVILMNTDGFYSTQPFELDIGEGLGQWSLRQHDWMLAVNAANYWCGSGAPETATGEEIEKRFGGLDHDSVSHLDVLEHYRRGKGEIRARVKRFYSLAPALAKGRHFRNYWLTWRTEYQPLRLAPTETKRIYPSDISQAADRLLMTRAQPTVDSYAVSESYRLKWEEKAS